MNTKNLSTKFLAASLAALISVPQIPVSVSAADLKSVSIAGNTYSYSAEALDGYTQIGNSGVYYALTDGTKLSGNLYGTSNLTYKEFYSGDVSSTDNFDVVTTATTLKAKVLSNAWTDYNEETTPDADGYHILGVSNVNVAVDSDLYVEASILKNSGTVQNPESDGSYVSNAKIIDTVTDATASLATASTWGEYEIEVKENSTKYLRNSREDTIPVGSTIQGIILETTDGYKVGLEHLSNIWVQPYKLAFNVNNEAATMGIAKSDNTAEFKKLVNKTIQKITYLTPNGNYVYAFTDGAFVKPAYAEEISGTFSSDMKTFTLNQVPTVKNGTLNVLYTVGSGRKKTSYTLYSDAVQKTVSLDFGSIPADAEAGTYSVSIASDDYADISVAIPITDQQKEQLSSLLKQAEAALAKAAANDQVLAAHKDEAVELLKSASATSADAADLINELTELLKPYQNTETPDTGDKTPETQPSESNQTPETQPSNTTPSTDKTSSPAKQTVKLKAFGKGKLKVSWKKDKNASGYEITYSTKKSFKNKKTVVVKSKKTTSKVIKKLKSKKTYYVKVRSYKKSGKTKVYGSYSKVKSLRSK